MKSTAEALHRARTRYAANPSHAPWLEHPRDGNVCLVLACACNREALNAVAAAAPFEMFNHNEGAIRWNAEHTTEDVLAAFDRAIAAEEARP